jgi:hypothetical protein
MQNALAGSKGAMFFQKKWTERKPLTIGKDLAMHRGALIAAICVGLLQTYQPRVSVVVPALSMTS